jgi:hypothetical protein
LLERCKDSINSIEEGESLEQKQNCLPFVSVETNLKNQHSVLRTKFMLYKTVLTQKPSKSDENYFQGSGIYQLTCRGSG